MGAVSIRNKYMVYDCEAQNHESFKRFCNPWDPRNYVVLRGYKIQGDTRARCTYHTGREPLAIPPDIKILVGHNLKFDMLFDFPVIREFIKDGGCIWDTQYAEYLLQGQDPAFHMNSLNTLAGMYGGTQKLDVVTQLWKSGVLTADINRDLLEDYLIGSPKEGFNGGDIGNTELVFLGQVKKARELGMVDCIFARMSGLLCTTEMEYNGLHIDTQEAERRRDVLYNQLQKLTAALSEFVQVPFEFNWGSPIHVSCLLFGGTIKYQVRAPILDEHGNQLYSMVSENYQDGVYKSGKRKGDPIIRTRKVPDLSRPKSRLEDRLFSFPGYVRGPEKFRLERTDAIGNPLYSVSWDSIQELRKYDIPFLKMLLQRADITKDLGTYYWVDEGKGKTGMLTCVQPDGKIHHSINHVNTVTGRLSSTNPNLQNIPREDTSEVKKMFVSRFPGGKMLEIDYNQLEIVGQAWLSGDKNLTQDIIDAIDMHCRRVAAKFHISYQDAVYWCKDETAPEHMLWKNRRTGAKSFSFQRAFGAGAAKIAESTGMTVQEVEDMIATEDALYPSIPAFNAEVAKFVQDNCVPFRDPIRGNKVYRRSYWRAPTGTRYTFRSYDAPAFLQKRGVSDTFKPTELKNYPVQGTSGELVQLVLGRLFHKFVQTDNYNGKAVLVNTVHDCVWADVHPDVVLQVAKDMVCIMESIPELIKEVYKLPCNVPFRVEVEVGDNLYSKEKLNKEVLNESHSRAERSSC